MGLPSYSDEIAETEYLYCEECGCEIRCGDEIGFQEVRTDRIPVGLIGEYAEVDRLVTMCVACADETGND